MKRLEQVVAVFFTSLGLVLAGFALLVTPRTAFADSGNCSASCCWALFDSSPCDGSSQAYMNCMSACYTCAQFQGDPDQLTTCCQTLCNGDQGCLDGCYGNAAGGCGGVVCNNPNLDCTHQKFNCVFKDGNIRCNQSSPKNDCSGCWCIDPLSGNYCRCAIPK
jgi:hypothetical protein